MKILPYNRLYSNSAMQNFNSICTVKSAVIDGEYYGQARETTLNQAARALSSVIHEGSLYGTALEKAQQFFPDSTKGIATTVACSHIRKNRVNVLVGKEAETYCNVFNSPIRSDRQRAKGIETIDKIIRDNNPESICIYATSTKNGNLTIKNIVKAAEVSKDNYLNIF